MFLIMIKIVNWRAILRMILIPKTMNMMIIDKKIKKRIIRISQRHFLWNQTTMKEYKYKTKIMKMRIWVCWHLPGIWRKWDKSQQITQKALVKREVANKIISIKVLFLQLTAQFWIVEFLVVILREEYSALVVIVTIQVVHNSDLCMIHLLILTAIPKKMRRIWINSEIVSKN